MGKSVGGKDRKRASFGLWGSPERQNWPVPCPVETPSTANPTGNLPPAVVRCMLSVGGNSIMEIPVLHNALRLSLLHFDGKRWASVIGHYREHSAFAAALALVVERDVCARRREVASRRVRSDREASEDERGSNHRPDDFTL